MKLIDRVREWVTTVIGILLMLAAVSMYVIGKFEGHEFTYMEIGAIAVLGYVFLMAKDSILEGVFLGLFKGRKDA